LTAYCTTGEFGAERKTRHTSALRGSPVLLAIERQLHLAFISGFLSHPPENVSVPWEKGCSFDNEVGQPLLVDVIRKRAFLSKE